PAHGSGRARQDPQRRPHLHHHPLRPAAHADLPPHHVRRPLGHRQLGPLPRRPEGGRTVSAAQAYRANPREIPAAWLAACGLLVLVGAAAFVVGLTQDPRTTWLAYHANFIYFATLSQSGLVLASALVIVGARWAGPIRHVAESLAAWVPVTFV